VGVDKRILKLTNQSGLGSKNILESSCQTKQFPVETTKIETSQATTVDSNDTLWGTPWTSSDKIIVQVANQNKNMSSHSTITKTNNIQFSLVKDSKSKELTEEK